MITIEARPEAVTLEARQAAVLVIDMQNDFAAPGGMFERAGIDVAAIQAAALAIRPVLDAARDAGMPVVYLKMEHAQDLSDVGPADGPHWLKHRPLHVGDEVTAPDGTPSRILVRDTWNTQIVPELAPAPNDIVISKHRYSGFFGTELDAVLRQLGVTHLLVTGCTTSICVESTVRDATFRDYSCVVLEDCTAEPIGADASRSNKEASLLIIETLFGWVSNAAAVTRALAALAQPV